MNRTLRASLLLLAVAVLAGCAGHGDDTPIRRGFYGGVSGGVSGL